MLFLAVFLALLFTCATQPVSIYQASAVPSSRILAPRLLSQAQYTGSLIIKRDTDNVLTERNENLDLL
jgi:hypothetical protein